MWGARLESQTCTNCEKKNPFRILQVKTHRKDCHGSHEWKETSYNIGNSRSWTNCEKKSVLDFTDETHDDNKEIIEEYVRFYFIFCNECEKIREVEYNVMTLNLQTLWEKKSVLDFTDENMWRTVMAARKEKA